MDIKSIMSLMPQVRKFQENLQTLQNDLAKKEVSGDAGGGMVHATFNARFDLLSLHIEPELIKPENAQMLNDLLLAALNDGLKRARDTARSEMGKLTGGMNIPGLL